MNECNLPDELICRIVEESNEMMQEKQGLFHFAVDFEFEELTPEVEDCPYWKIGVFKGHLVEECGQRYMECTADEHFLNTLMHSDDFTGTDLEQEWDVSKVYVNGRDLYINVVDETGPVDDDGNVMKSLIQVGELVHMKKPHVCQTLAKRFKTYEGMRRSIVRWEIDRYVSDTGRNGYLYTRAYEIKECFRLEVDSE